MRYGTFIPLLILLLAGCHDDPTRRETRGLPLDSLRVAGTTRLTTTAVTSDVKGGGFFLALPQGPEWTVWRATPPYDHDLEPTRVRMQHPPGGISADREAKLLAVSAATQLAVYSLSTGEEKFALNVSAHQLAISPNGRWLAVSVETGQPGNAALEVIDIDSKQVLWSSPLLTPAQLPVWHPVEPVVFMPMTDVLFVVNAVTGKGERLKTPSVDREEWERNVRLRHDADAYSPSERMTSISISPDGKRTAGATLRGVQVFETDAILTATGALPAPIAQVAAHLVESSTFLGRITGSPVLSKGCYQVIALSPSSVVWTELDGTLNALNLNSGALRVWQDPRENTVAWFLSISGDRRTLFASVGTLNSGGGAEGVFLDVSSLPP